MQKESGSAKAAAEGKRLCATSDAGRLLELMSQPPSANHRPLRPLVIGRELVRPSTPALPEVPELPSPGFNPSPGYYMPPIGHVPPQHVFMRDFRTLNFPDPLRIPLRDRREEFPAPGRRRILLPRWVLRPLVNTDPLNYQPPTPSFGDGPQDLVLADFVSRGVVRAHDSCEDARNPDGPTTCTSCPLFYFAVSNAHFNPPM